MTLCIVLVALGMAGYEALNEKFVSRDMLNKIFDKNIDKMYFLRQYLKNNDVSNRYVKTKRFVK